MPVSRRFSFSMSVSHVAIAYSGDAEGFRDFMASISGKPLAAKTAKRPRKAKAIPEEITAELKPAKFTP